MTIKSHNPQKYKRTIQLKNGQGRAVTLTDGQLVTPTFCPPPPGPFPCPMWHRDSHSHSHPPL